MLIIVFHSHRDLEQVREIRNELERRGHPPILFFLIRHRLKPELQAHFAFTSSASGTTSALFASG